LVDVSVFWVVSVIVLCWVVVVVVDICMRFCVRGLLGLWMVRVVRFWMVVCVGSIVICIFLLWVVVVVVLVVVSVLGLLGSRIMVCVCVVWMVVSSLLVDVWCLGVFGMMMVFVCFSRVVRFEFVVVDMIVIVGCLVLVVVCWFVCLVMWVMWMWWGCLMVMFVLIVLPTLSVCMCMFYSFLF